MFGFPARILSGSTEHKVEIDAKGQFTVINNLGLKQNLSTTFMFSLDKSMEEFPDLELCNIVMQDVNSYAIKTH